ncbi:MAG: SurA N-terminal domain-containing protein [Mesonia hippocampi]|uniref:peptidylprolyl isomerase n=1 Tax=Mesonia hippocampi TaxID=1628250 RepID=UPI003F9719D7
MAVLSKIREKTVFLIVIIALALFSFVLMDLFSNGGFSSDKSQNVIATINGEDVSREQFAMQVENYQRNSRGNITTTQAVNQVWDATLRNTLMKEQIDALGIEVGNDQLNNAIKQQFAGNPNFTNEAGIFDINKMREYVANLKASSPQAYQQWVMLEDNIAEQVKVETYLSLVKAGIDATLAEGKSAYQLANNTVNFKYVTLPYSQVADVEVTKEDIKAYINKHKEEFKSEAATDIQYVYFEEKASLEDENAIKAEIKKLLEKRVVYNQVSKMNDTLQGFANVADNEAFLAEFSDTQPSVRYFFKKDLPAEQADQIFALEAGQTYGPYKANGFYNVAKVVRTKQVADSVKANGMLISYKGTGAAEVNRTKEEAKNLADSLLTEIKTNSAKIATLATTLSDDPTTKNGNGELGWLQYAQVNQSSPVIEFLFDNAQGKVGVVETPAGFYVLEIAEAKNIQRAVEVTMLQKKIEPSEETSNALFTETTKFEIAAKQGNYNEEVKKASYEAKPVKGIKNMQENIPGLGSQRALVQWTFEEKTKAGDIKRFDLPTGYVVAQVTAKYPKGLMQVEEASAKVTPIIQREKKAEILKNKITAGTLAEIAKNQNVSVQTANAVNMKNPMIAGAGNEPEVVGAAFALAEGSLSKPIAGKTGVFVVETTAKKEAPALPSYKQMAAQESQARMMQVNRELYEALKAKAEISDNRANFY